MRRVWIIEEGEYEQRCIVGVADSVGAAVAYVKQLYAPPYEVRWEGPKESGWYMNGRRYESWTLIGYFASIPGKSVKHRADFDISPHDVFEESE